MGTKSSWKTAFAATAFLAAVSAFGDAIFWNPEVTSGGYLDGSSWIGGVAPQAGDTAMVSNVSATVSFPAGTTIHEGGFRIAGPSPESGESRTVVLDASDSVFSVSNDTESTQFRNIVEGWSYSNGWKPGAWRARSYRSNSTTPVESKHLTLDGAVVSVESDSDNVTMTVKSGTLDVSRRLVLRGYAGNGVTNWTTLVCDGGAVASGRRVNLQAFSRLKLGPGSYGFGIESNAQRPNSGEDSGFPVGPCEIEFLDGATNTSSNVAFSLGQYKNSNNLVAPSANTLVMRGRSRFVHSLESSGSQSNFQVANGEDSVAKATFLDFSSFYNKGHNTKTDGGNMTIGGGKNSRGEVAMLDSSALSIHKVLALGGTQVGSTALLCVSNNATVEVRASYSAATGASLRVGGKGSADACVEIADNATVTAPFVHTFADGTATGFVRAEIVLKGGALVAGAIEGSNTLTVVAAGGVLKAKAASTASAPFLHGVKSFSGADGAAARVIIDTQAYATYIDQDFGPGVTVVKRGNGTLYVKNSNHAKTVVEAGEVAFYDGATHFGDAWEVFDGATPPYAVEGATEAGDTFLASFSTQAAAEAFIDDYKAAYSPAYGWNYDFAVAEDGSGLWSVTATASEAVPADLEWSGASGDAWATATSWTPNQIPTHNDGVTVSGAATISMPSSARAKTLAFNGDGNLSFSGTSKLAVAESLSIAGDTAGAKVISVAAESSLEASAPAISVTTVALAKEGAGSLSMELPVKNTVTVLGAAAAADSANLSVREGSMTVKGAGAVISLSNFTPASTTQFSGTKKVGTTNLASAPSLAELVFDKCGASGAVTVGGGNADMSRLVVSNGAIIALGNVGVAAASGKTSELLLASGGKLAATPGNSVTLGSASASCGTTRADISGEGSSIYSTGGGNANGTIYFGAGLDAQVRDGGAIASDRSSSASNTRVLGWIAGNSYASGTVTFGEGGTISFGGGFCVNNYNVTASDSVKFTVAFDGGSFVPKQSATINTTEARNSRHAIFRSPEYQGFKVLAGGMNVDMSNSPRYVIAAPVRGTGALVKTGSGTLVMGTGRTYETTAYHNYWHNDGTASIVESGVVTVQNAGGVVVREGAVEIESGATDANSAFTVESGATLDLAGNTVSVGTVSGAGTVDGNGGVLRAVTLKPVQDGGDLPSFEDVSFGGRSVTVDFEGVAGPVKGRQFLVAHIGSGVSGIGDGTVAKVANAGDEGIETAVLSIDSGGNVYARPTSSSGLILFVR